MLKELIESLHAAKAQVDTLQARVEKRVKEALATLPEEYGFDSVEAFIKAVKKASNDAEKRGREVANRAFPRSKRAKITAAVRATVKNLVAAGKSAGDIAEAVGISPASVQNIKKSLGLVRPAKRNASRKAERIRKPSPAKRRAVRRPKRKDAAPKKPRAAAAAAPDTTEPPPAG